MKFWTFDNQKFHTTSMEKLVNSWIERDIEVLTSTCMVYPLKFYRLRQQSELDDEFVTIELLWTRLDLVTYPATGCRFVEYIVLSISGNPTWVCSNTNKSHFFSFFSKTWQGQAEKPNTNISHNIQDFHWTFGVSSNICHCPTRCDFSLPRLNT